MKNVISLLAAAFLITSPMYGGAGYFDSFTIVNSTFYDLGASTSNDDFNGLNLGVFNLDDSISIGGQIKTYKNNGTDVTGANLSYLIRETGIPAGGYTDIGYSWQANLGTFGDQQWGNESGTTVSLSSLSAGDYQLSIYASVFTNGFEAFPQIYDNNTGLNYVASFTVVPEPSSFALIGSLFSLSLVALRRKFRS